MITEKEFLDAFEIIKKYKSQVDDIYHKSEAILKEKTKEKFIELKRNDWIEITEANGESKYFKVGERFRVLSSRLYFDYYKHNDKFEIFCKEKYGEVNKEYKSFDLYQNDLIELDIPFCQIVTLALPNKSSYSIRSTSYKYRIVKD